MAATLGSMVERVLDHLYGHSAVQDATAQTTGAITATDLSFTVDDATSVGTGLVEIDSELMKVKEVDLQAGIVKLAAKGRGARGTTAAAHDAGSEVRIAPVMPYSSVIAEVNAEVAALFPRICAVGTVEFASSATSVTYDLPADAVFVLDVRWRDPMGEWQRVRHWEAEHSGNTMDHPTGKTVRIASPDVGKIRVVYGKPFTELTSLTDSLATAGIPESCEDVIRMGAMVRLLPSMDIARLSVVSMPSASTADRSPQPGTGIQVARELRQMYMQRLIQEVATFRLRFPVRQHFTR